MPKFPWIALSAFLVLSSVAPVLAGSVLGEDFSQDETHDYGGLPKLRLNLETGYSLWIYNPDSLSPAYEKYLNKLESGWNLAADIVYFPWAKGGIGVTWIWFLSHAEQNGVQMDTGSTALSDLRDRASYVYYGPTFMSRLQAGRFGLLVGSFSMGWLDVHYTFSENGETGDVKAGQLAAVANVGWEYAAYRLVSFGVNARMLLCDIQKYTYNGKEVNINDGASGPDQWAGIGMSRFELDFGIRFGL